MSKPLVLNNEIRKRLKEEMKLIYEITKAKACNHDQM